MNNHISKSCKLPTNSSLCLSTKRDKLGLVGRGCGRTTNRDISIWDVVPINRKAQIPMILIPFITIVLVLIALFAFASFNNNIEKLSGELSKLTEEITFNQQYIIAQAKLITNETLETCQNCNPEQLKGKFQKLAKEKEELFRYPPAENLYGKIHRGEFEITHTNLTIIEIFTESKIEKHKIRRNFDIKLKIPKEL